MKSSARVLRKVFHWDTVGKGSHDASFNHGSHLEQSQAHPGLGLYHATMCVNYYILQMRWPDSSDRGVLGAVPKSFRDSDSLGICSINKHFR